MTPEFRRHLANARRRSPDGPQSLEPQGAIGTQTLSCAACIANVIESHQLYLESIQEELATQRGLRTQVLQLIAADPNNANLLTVFANIQNAIEELQADERDQGNRLSGAEDCSGC